MIKDLHNILERLKREDRLAFRMLYNAYAPLVYDLAVKLLKNHAAAEEVVQDCFIRLWGMREQINVEGELWPLLYVTAKRLCFNQMRHARVAQKYIDQVEGLLVNDVQQRMDVRELEMQLERSIESLPEQQKRALRLSRVEGYTHQQIAHEMGISQNTVKNHIAQALKKLRQSLLQADFPNLLLLLTVFFS